MCRQELVSVGEGPETSTFTLCVGEVYAVIETRMDSVYVLVWNIVLFSMCLCGRVWNIFYGFVWDDSAARHLLISMNIFINYFSKTTPPQNRQLIVYHY